jgi:two-component system, sensor histidine kinase and response regulator
VNAQPLEILIVDDTPQNLVALEALLRRTGVELVTATSGPEALEHCLRHDFCLALLDVQMPEMDGFELAELMRGAERTKHVPIIFVTAGARDQNRMFKGYESGAVDFLYKPIDPQILTSKITVFLQLAEQRRELSRVLQLNEMFVGILGHDLRNPLAAIMAGTELLRLQLTEQKQLDVLERMRQSTLRMEKMIGALLDLTHARLASGLGLARSRQRVELRHLLQQTIDELRIAHDRELHLDAAEPCHMSGDPERLAQLFSNLLANAITHGRPDAPVTTRLTSCEGNNVVEIHNAGTIPAEVATTLFEPFKRPRNTKGGLGLGLYIAREIARAHGGDIDVHSAEPAGTTFKVRLPEA